MRPYLEQACEIVDAAIFNGDVLYSDEERTKLKEYVERWTRAIAQHEASAAEAEWRDKGSPINPADFSASEYPLECTSGWAPRRYGIEVTHIPTGMSERCGDERSAHRNKVIAYERLLARLRDELAASQKLAADRLDEQRQMGADLSDIERLRMEKDAKLYADLAASQAREKELRDRIHTVIDQVWQCCSHERASNLSDALTLPADDTALRAALDQRERETIERCAKAFSQWDREGRWAASVIRAMLSVAPKPECHHQRAILQQTGDGTPVEFCPDCGRNEIVGSAPKPEGE